MKKILVYRIGSLGDNLVALPAIWTIRENFPDSSLYLIGSKFQGSNRVMGQEIFEGSGLFKGYFEYPNPMSLGRFGRLLFPLSLAKIWFTLKSEGFETLVYLAPSIRTKRQIERDRKFFKLLGIKRMIGMDGFHSLPEKEKGQPLPRIPYEADLLLKRLEFSGVKVPGPGQGKINLVFTEEERIVFRDTLSVLPFDGNRFWIGIGPGSNQPATIWPNERYENVISELILKYDIWPVVFGGKKDEAIGEKFLAKWKRGYNFAGLLSVRLAGLALEKCRLYLGNDTGTMHLAASVETPCVAVFSSHNYPGKWFPYGSNHKVFYEHVECEGCGLVECVEEKMKCILSIKPAEVFKACETLMKFHA